MPEFDFAFPIDEFLRTAEKFHHDILDKIIAFVFIEMIEMPDISDNGCVSLIELVP